MRVGRAALLALLALTLACSSAPSLPRSTTPWPAPDAIVAWIGHGHAERFRKGVWTPAPELDYDFTLVQRRYPGRSVAIKELHHRHPDYPRIAGPRDETLLFEVGYRVESTSYALSVHSSLGTGVGSMSRDQSRAELVVVPEKTSLFSPYDHVRLRQTIDWERGQVEEKVELFSLEKDGTEAPFVRISEAATILRPGGGAPPPLVSERSH